MLVTLYECFSGLLGLFHLALMGLYCQADRSGYVDDALAQATYDYDFEDRKYIE